MKASLTALALFLTACACGRGDVSGAATAPEFLAAAGGTTFFDPRYVRLSRDTAWTPLIQLRVGSRVASRAFLPLIVVDAQDMNSPLPLNGYYLKTYSLRGGWLAEVHKVVNGHDPGPIGGLSETLPENLGDGSFHLIQVWVQPGSDGNSLTLSVDGTRIGTWADVGKGAFSGGYAGFSAHFSRTDAYVRDWQVSSPAR